MINKTIDLLPKKTRSVSPSDYLEMPEEERRNIKHCKFVPPDIGSASFGKFVITLKQPIYSVGHGEAE